MDLPLPMDVGRQLSTFKHTLELLQAGIRPCLQNAETMSALEKAELHVTLAETVKVAFDLYLQAQGIAPGEHPISKEEERIGRYKRKLSKVQSETILKTTKRKTEVNVQAANRFITAAIPELTSQQKSALRQSGAKQKALANTPDRSKAASANDEALQFLKQAMAEAKPKAG